jgi:Bardet-Biedl syndrome 7 protein
MRETYHSTLGNTKTLSQLRAFQINDRFELNRDDASYVLSLESEMPIDNILLQCDVPIDLLDSDKNSCVLSYSDCNENVKLLGRLGNLKLYDLIISCGNLRMETFC